ncbi:uncharacterized protein LOC132785277 [Drosophila nasuta]|uniref:uncharacterized protein LOC132785277 n=1 Tax=Drosophila nasuta TaxID=42062 RepID=UPI00295F4EAA|nr:uncharacterized protein LOC132785277 [Drosophila nasuta]XP_060647274.1 uncharacterized protein LOC132785277 [Drosophila nasuta]
MKMKQANLNGMPTSVVTVFNVMSSKQFSKASRAAHSTATATATAASTSTSARATGPLFTLMLLATILCCISNFGLVEGLKCHMCGQYNEGVGSITPCTNYSKEIEHLYLKECTKRTEKFCVKYVSELSTVRDCATECVEKEIWETQTYCCTEDGCNSGGHLKYSILLLVFPLLNLIWLTIDNF